LHSAKKQFQPRLGFAWDISKQGKSVLRANAGIYYGRQNMLSQVGSITDNGVQQFGIACGSSFGCSNGQGLPVWPNIVNVPPLGGLPAFASIRVFSKDYANPRIYTANVQFEQQLTDDLGLPAPVDARAIADRRATLAAVPHLHRPANRTEMPGFVIAGDWTESDYPSTLETAVRSGRAAARALLHRP
jgi:hypothetical protein